MQLSVGIPFFNSAKTLRWSVNSVLAQAFQDWELLLIDDGSTDDSIQSIADIEDSRIRILSDGKRLGLPARLNQIATLARGMYLARMDSDDLMFPERLARQVAYLHDNPDVDIVSSGIVSIDHDNEPTSVRGCNDTRVTIHDILRRGGFVHPTVMGRTSWFRNNSYTSRYPRAEDRELWARTCSQSMFRVIPEPLLFYREIGLVSPEKILIGYSSERRIMKRYGTPLLGRLSVADIIARSFLKSFLLSSPLWNMIQDFFVLMRGTSISEQDKARYRCILQTVLSGKPS